jgi:very-short-patch-repair endonuclease
MVGVAAQLNTSRQALLDLSTRNRLLNIPRRSKNVKTIEVIGESSVEVFKLLVKEGKALSFLPAREADGDVPDEDSRDKLPQPEGDGSGDGDSSKRDSRRLQTPLSSERLQKRLLSLFHDAKTLEEEQGVNILYLAIGVLKWFEDDNSSVERYAPLILVPVSLERGSANERFKLRWRDEDITANLSLQAKMKAEFGLVIPDLSEDDDLDVNAYMSAVLKVVSAKKRFEVKGNDIVLGFFSFAKFLMYRDLDAANWPEFSKLDNHPLIKGLMRDGFPAAEGMISEDAQVDEYLTPAQMLHVVDADSSQTLAIEEVRRGRNLVIQGPPGTGKSQTITNIIASAVADGKKVLFVSEKMAALEVVQRRMATIGLGPLCLELHSHKANKRGVLEELKRTRELGRPRSYDGNQAAAKLQLLRDKLNKYAAVLHTPQQPSGLTAFQIIGNLVRNKEDGVEARSIVLDNPQSWSADDKKDREELLADITARIRNLGIPAHHPWRGVCRLLPLLPNEFDRLFDTLTELRQALDLILADVARVERTFPSATTSLDTLNTANATVKAVLTLPKADNTSLAHPLWQNGMPLLIELVQSGERYAELKQKLTGVITDTAWSANLTECRQQIATHGGSLLRFMHVGYRRALTLLQSLLAVPLPKKQVERLALIDDIITLQRLEKFLQQYHEAGIAAFGHMWQGTQSNWPHLSALVAWCSRLPPGKLSSDFLKQCAKITSIDEWKDVAAHLQQRVPEFFTKLAGLCNGLQLDIQVAFDVPAIEAVDRQALADRLTLWNDNSESLSKWIAFKGKHQALQAVGMRSIADKLWRGALALDKAKAIFERAYFYVLAEEVFTIHPQLREFDGDQHNLLVANFREGDRHRIEQTRVEILSKHYATMPRGDSGIGALGVLSGEFAKKRNHLPIRKLMKKAGGAIQALKPVFMMSPLSVAQFLEPGALQFDLLVMDEASQVEPVDALGAIARAKQIVVVGDERQLPPTQFFLRMTTNIGEEEDDDDDNTVATHDVESILNLCLARGLPQRMLRWHYRSKHHSLIAVSNKQFYNNRLFIVPSPYDVASGMGLVFHHLPEATFDSGGTATNPIEAKAVAHAVIRHAKEHPHLSLGVGAFSVKQKQAILDEVELLRRAHPETEQFFTQAHQDEPFFVKNLENIQGDERDVIFISVGYGRNQSGYMAMRFGPLNAEGGERRLNVLISRAKRRCEVFSSITADDIDLERGKGAGVMAFKLFLKFAQTGKLDFGQVTDREADSVFEEQVAAALRAKGYVVKMQIGIAGFFVDLAIVDVDKPGRFLIGIECDGASYHSSRSARDRDRLRQAVLEDHGWIIHRIWSTDWFRRPKEQLEKTILAIEEAKRVHEARGQQTGIATASNTFEIVAHVDDRVIELPASVTQKKLAVPYKEAVFWVPTHTEPHMVLDRDMAGIVEKIVEIEGPIHIEEIVARVRILWNLGRAGERIHNKVKAGLNWAMWQEAVKREGPFYFKPMAVIPVRDRSGVSSPGLRKPESLPPQEIRKAILLLVEENYGVSRDQLPVEVARLFGFKATSAQLREVIEQQIQAMLSSKSLRDMDGHVTTSVERNLRA